MEVNSQDKKLTVKEKFQSLQKHKVFTNLKQ